MTECGSLESSLFHNSLKTDYLWVNDLETFQDAENLMEHAFIDYNTVRGIVPDNLTFSRKQGILIREREKARYRLRWEIERTFSILEEIMHSEHIWYVRNRKL